MSSTVSKEYMHKGVVNNYGRGAGWNSGVMKYFGELRGATNVFECSQGALKHFDLKYAYQYYGTTMQWGGVWQYFTHSNVGCETFACVQEGPWTFYHWGTFQSTLSHGRNCWQLLKERNSIMVMPPLYLNILFNLFQHTSLSSRS